jgi:hypothetical protein
MGGKSVVLLWQGMGELNEVIGEEVRIELRLKTPNLLLEGNGTHFLFCRRGLVGTVEWGDREDEKTCMSKTLALSLMKHLVFLI